MVSWGGLGGLAPLRNLRYPCLAPRGGLGGLAPQESPLITRALPPQRPCLAPVPCPQFFFVRNFFVGIFSSEFFSSEFFLKTYFRKIFFEKDIFRKSYGRSWVTVGLPTIRKFKERQGTVDFGRLRHRLSLAAEIRRSIVNSIF